MKIPVCFFIFFILFISARAQNTDDTTIIIDNQRITLPEVIVHNNLDYLKILERIKNDTTFYKAFRNLHVVEFSSYNNIRMLDKKGAAQATYNSETIQHRNNGCRTTEVVEQQSTGDFFDRKGNYNYTTGEMYASLFFTKGKICGENNIVAGRSFNPDNKTGIEKHKEQLKMLFFNPGKKIPGIPFIGDKLDLYDDHAHKLYDYKLEFTDYKGSYAYKFSITPKDDLGFFNQGDIVVDKMITWFDYNTLEVIARDYSLSYHAGVYNFDVSMQVEMGRAGNLLVPKTMRYKGNFSVMFKKKERGEFTATLFDFKN